MASDAPLLTHQGNGPRGPKLPPPPTSLGPTRTGLVSRAPVSGFRHGRLERSGNVPRALLGLGTGGTRVLSLVSRRSKDGVHPTTWLLMPWGCFLWWLLSPNPVERRRETEASPQQGRGAREARAVNTSACASPRDNTGLCREVYVKREARKTSAHSPLRIWYSNLLLESGRGRPEGRGWEGRWEVVLSEDELCVASRKTTCFWTSEAADLRSKAWEVMFGGWERRSF